MREGLNQERSDSLTDPVTEEQAFAFLMDRLRFHGLYRSESKKIECRDTWESIYEGSIGQFIVFTQCEKNGHVILGVISNIQLVAGQLVIEMKSGSESIFFRDSGEHTRSFGDGRHVTYPPTAMWYIPSNSENARPSHGWSLRARYK